MSRIDGDDGLIIMNGNGDGNGRGNAGNDGGEEGGRADMEARELP